MIRHARPVAFSFVCVDGKTNRETQIGASSPLSLTTMPPKKQPAPAPAPKKQPAPAPASAPPPPRRRGPTQGVVVDTPFADAVMVAVVTAALGALFTMFAPEAYMVRECVCGSVCVWRRRGES